MLERGDEGYCNRCGKPWPEPEFDDLPKKTANAKVYYHGSPRADLRELHAGSYVTPHREIAELMGRFYPDTGQTWKDADLAEPYGFKGQAKFAPGREPTGVPTVYEVAATEADLDLLDNDKEHKTRKSLPVKTARYITRQELMAIGKTVNTSPTEAQQVAGNYQKGHVLMHGLDISIENPKGSTRSGTSKSGKKWSTKMYQHYGYIKGSEGKDGDHVDVFIGDHPESELVFVVDQLDPSTGRLDEHKCMLGFFNAADAEAAYLDNYEDGWQGLGSITGLTMSQFKTWLESGDQTKRLAGQTIKLAEQPAYVRSLNTQLASPSWDATQGIVGNIVQNASQWKDRGQQMVNDQTQAQQFAEHQNPGLAWGRLQAMLGGRVQLGVADPVDRLLFQPPA